MTKMSKETTRTMLACLTMCICNANYRRPERHLSLNIVAGNEFFYVVDTPADAYEIEGEAVHFEIDNTWFLPLNALNVSRACEWVNEL